ncbi:unnamed protein product [Prunus armeniaca]
MDKLVSPNQVSFVPGRQITDNIMVVQEVLHKFRTFKGRGLSPGKLIYPKPMIASTGPLLGKCYGKGELGEELLS